MLGPRLKVVVMLCDPAKRMYSDFMRFEARRLIKMLKQRTKDMTGGSLPGGIAPAAFVPSPKDFQRHVTEAMMWFKSCERCVCYSQSWKREREREGGGLVLGYVRSTSKSFPQRVFNPPSIFR